MAFRDYDDDVSGDDTRAHVKLQKVGRNTPEREKRICVLHIRVSRDELDDFYLHARDQRRTMSYLIRDALEKHYPEIFVNINRYVQRKSRKKPGPKPNKSYILKSFDGGSVRVADTPLDKKTEDQ